MALHGFCDLVGPCPAHARGLSKKTGRLPRFHARHSVLWHVLSEERGRTVYQWGSLIPVRVVVLLSSPTLQAPAGPTFTTAGSHSAPETKSEKVEFVALLSYLFFYLTIDGVCVLKGLILLILLQVVEGRSFNSLTKPSMLE